MATETNPRTKTPPEERDQGAHHPAYDSWRYEEAPQNESGAHILFHTDGDIIVSPPPIGDKI